MVRRAASDRLGIRGNGLADFLADGSGGMPILAQDVGTGLLGDLLIALAK